MQATALGCFGVGFIFVSGIPALAQMGLLDPQGGAGYGALVCLTIMCGYWGMAFTVPLRSLFILKLARPLKLNFPMGTASALTIRTLHSKSADSKDSTRNLYAISISFGVSLVWSVVSSYAVGILYNWNIFWWVYKWGGTSIIAAVSWGWFSWSWSPAILAMGMFIGLNPLSFLGGSFFAWGVIGPILVKTGAATGLPMNPAYPGLMTYNAFDPSAFLENPSPRYWILWPAVFMMLSTSLATIALESKSLGWVVVHMFKDVKGKFTLNRDNGGPLHTNERPLAPGEMADSVPEEYHVRWWEWSTLALVSFVFSLIAMHFVFSITPEMGLLHLVLGFLWAVVVVQLYGAVGTTPIASIAKCSQFITGAILKERIGDIGFNSAARNNLVGATISEGAAQQAAELVQDFRTGFLLGTPMRAQWYAQLFGVTVSTLLAPGLFLLFTKAYPCIIDATVTECQFALPSVMSWKVITIGILSPVMPISKSSWIACIICSIIGIAVTVLTRWMNRSDKYRHLTVYIPNMSVVAMAWTVPSPNMATTVAIGATAAALWARFGKDSHAKYFYAVAAGGVAGEGVANVIISVLQIAQVAGSQYGTKVGCVAEMC